jgi:predicted enzyme related to lactoylglutathione lyase
MANDKRVLPGKFGWCELITDDPRKAQQFYAQVFGWTQRAANGYEVIYAGEHAIGGCAPARGAASHWLTYASVTDIERATAAAAAGGGRVTQSAFDIPGLGRAARLEDPTGAALGVLTRSAGDPADVEWAPDGTFYWNELHTPDAAKALRFYEQALGYTHDALPGPGGAYHVLHQSGQGRGGLSTHIGGAERAHWLPYVMTSDADKTIARAKECGGTIMVGPADIPGIGRFGVIQDPTGATLATMKPLPRMERKA